MLAAGAPNKLVGAGVVANREGVLVAAAVEVPKVKPVAGFAPPRVKAMLCKIDVRFVRSFLCVYQQRLCILTFLRCLAVEKHFFIKSCYNCTLPKLP